MRWLLRVLLMIGVAFVVAWGLARLADGPIGPMQGGEFRSGERVAASRVDWSFAESIETIEFQLLEPPRSRTVWVVVYGEQLYVPCAAPNFRLWKQWPHQAMKDGRSILRIDGKLYETQAERVTQPALVKTLAGLTADKYEVGMPAGSDDPDAVWFFRMAPRG